MDEPVCPGFRDTQKRIAEPEALVAVLTRKHEETMRVGKRQAATIRKGLPKPAPRIPGRKSGDALDTLVGTGTTEQFHTEIPRQPRARKFVVHPGRCTDCGSPAHGRHPLMTSHSPGAAASQIGPDAQAAGALLNV